MSITVAAPPVAARAPAPSRILALDTARGLAVLGMIVAHVGVTRSLSWGDPGSWLAVAHGRSAILFATLAGVSIALISGRQRPPTGSQLVAARTRILVRACVLFAIGGVLTALDTGISVILQTYALLFVCCLPFLTWTPRRLLILAAGWAVVAPALTIWLSHLLSGSCDRSDETCSGAQITDLAVIGEYPGLVWITFALVGLALGRSDLGSTVLRMRLLVAGASLMILGYGGGWLATNLGEAIESDWAQLLTAEPHSGTTFEIAGSLGFALTVLGALLLTVDRMRPLLFPISAVGSIPLTVYAAHIVAVRFLSEGARESTGNTVLAIFLGITIASATLYVLVLGRGPLERLVTWVGVRATTPGRAPSPPISAGSAG
ncbi:heparan-alpha-glucosaminide N-acetyltransferase domain-containing protein [Nocardia sp. NPDC051030]|uniref:heparan-alpha-glucosaminide N-acetyltransferase domain-containing protein n=1 Tax=Nocardia sp. NPDC051030 TaxID=3155162 RepID=UPI00343C0510